VSASLKEAGWLPWKQPELARAKALRAEGYTHGTIAGMLRDEFGTVRTGLAVQKLFAALRQKGVVVDPVPTHQAKAAEVRKAELVVANNVQRQCLLCRRNFYSWGAGNRRCDPCKRSGD